MTRPLPLSKDQLRRMQEVRRCPNCGSAKPPRAITAINTRNRRSSSGIVYGAECEDCKMGTKVDYTTWPGALRAFYRPMGGAR